MGKEEEKVLHSRLFLCIDVIIHVTAFLAPAVDVEIAGVDQGKGLMSEKMGKRALWTEPVSL